MNEPNGPAAPASGTANDDIPSFDELLADSEIAALLDFEPVERKLQKANGWTPAMQRMFIAWLAYYGSPGKAADELGKARSGIDKVYKAEGADSFRAAWDGAVALNERRRMERLASARSGAGAMKPPSPSPAAATPPFRPRKRAGVERPVSPARSSTNMASGRTRPRSTAAPTRRSTTSPTSSAAPADCTSRRSAARRASAPPSSS